MRATAVRLSYKTFASVLIVLFALGIAIFLFGVREDQWSLTLPGVGTYSSCRTADLDGDGTLDIILGAGGKEYESSDYGVIAVNGADGKILWTVPCRNQMIGSPVFADITRDGIQDVFIGGRSAQLLAINGRDGRVLWEFMPSTSTMDLANDTLLLNFFNPQWVEDYDQDGLNDLLISFGGYVKALPEDTGRPAGYLMIISAKSGELLGRAAMPGGRETYMSPVVHDFDKNGKLSVVFGSGGETINGGLYVAEVASVLKGSLHNAKKLADGKGKGFISPPVLVDINGDEILDIVTNSFDGRMLSFDGNDFKLLWETSIGEGLETYSSVAPVYLEGNDTPTFFASFGMGTWPNNSGSVQVVVDGKSGRINSYDTLGIFQYASPVVFDFTRDGNDDVLFPINLMSQPAFEPDSLDDHVQLYRYSTAIYVYDIKNNDQYQLGHTTPGTNMGSTPLLTDLEGDRKLDVITCHMTDAFDFFAFKNLVITRTEIRAPVGELYWTAYGGTFYNGRVTRDQNP